MSRTIRRKNRKTPRGYYQRWQGSYTGEVDMEWVSRNGGSLEKIHKQFHSDSWWKMGPRTVGRDTEEKLRVYNKNELSKAKKDPDYEIMCVKQMPKDWSC